MRLQSDLFFVCATLRDVFAADTVCCVLVDPSNDELVVVAADGVGAPATVGTRMPSGAGLIGYVVTSKVPLDKVDLRRDERYLVSVSERSGYLPQTLMGAPLLADDDRCLGLITVMDPAPATDGGLELALLTVAAAPGRGAHDGRRGPGARAADRRAAVGRRRRRRRWPAVAPADADPRELTPES